MHSIIITGIDFCAAHRVEGHPKCGRLHGHNYSVSVEIAAETLDQQGFVIDFGVAKKVFKKYIDDNWDHRYLVSERNIASNDPYYLAVKDEVMCDDTVVIPVHQTTAEYLSQYLYSIFTMLVFQARFTIVWVQVQETPTSSARFYAPRIVDEEG